MTQVFHIGNEFWQNIPVPNTCVTGNSAIITKNANCLPFTAFMLSLYSEYIRIQSEIKT